MKAIDGPQLWSSTKHDRSVFSDDILGLLLWNFALEELCGPTLMNIIATTL